MKVIQFIFFLMLITITLGATRSTIAGSASAPLSVAVTVVRSCHLSTSPLAIGNYEPTNANINLTADANMAVVCTRGSNPSIAVGLGSQASVTLTLREMSNGGGKLGYEIHKNSGLAEVGAESGSIVFRLGTILLTRDQTVPVSRIPGGQNVPGRYNDAVIVTVNF
jgi:spore coat protein U-like protein